MKPVHIIAGALLLCSSAAQATLVSVAGPASSTGTSATIIGAPTDILDDLVINSGMQGFDEAQGVVTSVAHGIDGGGVIAAGTRVNSHMIFLNSSGGTRITHSNVDWTFDGTILGVMSDSGGTLEAASTFELGNPATNYTVTFPGSGPAAPFNARGLESNDSYMLMALNVLRVSMIVTEPGDWIRVITASAVPVPAAVWLFGSALVGFIGFSRRTMVA